MKTVKVNFPDDTVYVNIFYAHKSDDETLVFGTSQFAPSETQEDEEINIPCDFDYAKRIDIDRSHKS